jgi:uncharacterized protein YndB with AHSA1/START domain
MKYADTPTVETQTYVDAPPERVWPLVTDFDLMISMSSELRGIEWEGDGAEPAVGRRYVGHNFHKDFGGWETTSTVIAYDPPREFAWAVSDVDYPSSVWRFTLRAEGAGTVLTQWMQIGPARSGLSFAIDRMPDKEERIIARRLNEFRSAMEKNLGTFKELSEKAAS